MASGNSWSSSERVVLFAFVAGGVFLQAGLLAWPDPEVVALFAVAGGSAGALALLLQHFDYIDRELVTGGDEESVWDDVIVFGLAHISVSMAIPFVIWSTGIETVALRLVPLVAGLIAVAFHRYNVVLPIRYSSDKKWRRRDDYVLGAVITLLVLMYTNGIVGPAPLVQTVATVTGLALGMYAVRFRRTGVFHRPGDRKGGAGAP